jgi:hypothetical protein
VPGAALKPAIQPSSVDHHGVDCTVAPLATWDRTGGAASPNASRNVVSPVPLDGPRADIVGAARRGGRRGAVYIFFSEATS